MRTLVLLIASPHFSAELWYDQLRPSFFSVVNGVKTASQKVRVFCAASHLAGKKFPIAHQFARVAILQTGADALGQTQRDTLEGHDGLILLRRGLRIDVASAIPFLRFLLGQLEGALRRGKGNNRLMLT